MTLAYWCVLFAILIPYLFTAIAKYGNGFNSKANLTPRQWQADLKGWGSRAHAAHLNGFEVLPAFAAAVIIAHLAGNASQRTIDILAIVFIVSRVAHGAIYIANWSRPRTLAFGIGLLCILGLFLVSA
jgi:uncharacterized MAPEG superfamily protein